MDGARAGGAAALRGGRLGGGGAWVRMAGRGGGMLRVRDAPPAAEHAEDHPLHPLVPQLADPELLPGAEVDDPGVVEAHRQQRGVRRQQELELGEARRQERQELPLEPDVEPGLRTVEDQEHDRVEGRVGSPGAHRLDPYAHLGVERQRELGGVRQLLEPEAPTVPEGELEPLAVDLEEAGRVADDLPEHRLLGLEERPGVGAVEDPLAQGGGQAGGDGVGRIPRVEAVRHGDGVDVEGGTRGPGRVREGEPGVRVGLGDGAG
jgi:hypothetical protein